MTYWVFKSDNRLPASSLPHVCAVMRLCAGTRQNSSFCRVASILPLFASICLYVWARLFLSLPARGERAGERGSYFRDLSVPKNFVIRPFCAIPYSKVERGLATGYMLWNTDNYMRADLSDKKDLSRQKLVRLHKFASEDLVGCISTSIKSGDNATVRRLVRKRMNEKNR